MLKRMDSRELTEEVLSVAKRRRRERSTCRKTSEGEAEDLGAIVATVRLHGEVAGEEEVGTDLHRGG